MSDTFVPRGYSLLCSSLATFIRQDCKSKGPQWLVDNKSKLAWPRDPRCGKALSDGGALALGVLLL